VIGKSDQERIDTCRNCPVPGGCDPAEAVRIARTRQIIDMVTAGMSHNSIAQALDISTRTVQRVLQGKRT